MEGTTQYKRGGGYDNLKDGRWSVSRLEQLRHNNLFGADTGLLVDRCVSEWRGGENFSGWPVMELLLMTLSSALVKFPI